MMITPTHTVHTGRRMSPFSARSAAFAVTSVGGATLG